MIGGTRVPHALPSLVSTRLGLWRFIGEIRAIFRLLLIISRCFALFLFPSDAVAAARTSRMEGFRVSTTCPERAPIVLLRTLRGTGISMVSIYFPNLF